MRIMTTLALVAVLAAPTLAQQRDSLSRDERTRLEARLEQLSRELRDLEQQLGRSRVVLRTRDNEPFVWSIGTGNRARLGVIVATGSDETDVQGARLQAVTPNGPAAEAGLRAGDVITSVNGQSLANARPSPGERLIQAVDDLNDGDSVQVEYRRGGAAQRATIVARAIDAPGFGLRTPGFTFQMDTLRLRRGAVGGSVGVLDRALMEVRAMPGLRSAFFTSDWSSMELTTLDADLGSYFGTSEGVLVVRVPSDSLLGLKSGDVIQRIGGRAPTSPAHAIRILRSYEPGDEIRIEIMRQRRAQTLNATVPERDRDRGLFWEWEN